MRSRLNATAVAIAAALDKHAAQVTQRHAMAWDVIFRNGRSLPAHVEIDADRVHLNAPIVAPLLSPIADPLLTKEGTGGVYTLWSLLVRNASLPPGIKLAVAVGETVAPRVRLCGEIILDDAAEPAVRMSELCAAIKQVAHVWPASAPAPGVETMATVATDVAALCHDTGWPVVERDGRVLVELDIPDGFAQADVAARPDGGIGATVAVADGAAPAPCHDALALLLLRASGSVYLVRAAAEPTPRFEVALPAPIAAATLQHALCALSVAYRMVVREATTLAQDASIAAAYLRHAPALVTSTVTQP